MEVFESMLEGFEKASRVIYRGRILESLYFPNSSDDHQSLKTALIKLYAATLEYLVEAMKYYSAGSGKRFLYSALHHSKSLSIIQEIDQKDGDVESLRILVDAQRQQHCMDKVSQVAKSINDMGQEIKTLQITQSE